MISRGVTCAKSFNGISALKIKDSNHDLKASIPLKVDEEELGLIR